MGTAEGPDAASVKPGGVVAGEVGAGHELLPVPVPVIAIWKVDGGLWLIPTLPGEGGQLGYVSRKHVQRIGTEVPEPTYDQSAEPSEIAVPVPLGPVPELAVVPGVLHM